MISSSIHAIKEGRQHAKPPWLHGIDLRLNTETNKLESIVNSDGKSGRVTWQSLTCALKRISKAPRKMVTRKYRWPGQICQVYLLVVD